MLDGSVLWNESLSGPLGTSLVLNQQYLLLVAFSGNFSSTCGSLGCGSFRGNRVDPTLWMRPGKCSKHHMEREITHLS